MLNSTKRYPMHNFTGNMLDRKRRITLAFREIAAAIDPPLDFRFFPKG
ncbi:hypothetical protein [Pontibacter russatus]|nr:hypothetical protein [Pontibacter russatus]